MADDVRPFAEFEVDAPLTSSEILNLIRWILGEEPTSEPTGVALIVRQARKFVRSGERGPTPDERALLVALTERIQAQRDVETSLIERLIDSVLRPTKAPFSRVLRQVSVVILEHLGRSQSHEVAGALERALERIAGTEDEKSLSLILVAPIAARLSREDLYPFCTNLTESDSPRLRFFGERLRRFLNPDWRN